MTVTESQKAAKRRYDTLRTKQYVFRLRLGADADVIEALDTCENKTELLRKLVRRYVNGSDK